MSATEYAAAAHLATEIYEKHEDMRTLVEGARLEVRLPGPQQSPNAMIVILPGGEATLVAGSETVRSKISSLLRVTGFKIVEVS